MKICGEQLILKCIFTRKLKKHCIKQAHISFEAKTASVQFVTFCSICTFCCHWNFSCRWNLCCHWNFCRHWNLVAIGTYVAIGTFVAIKTFEAIYNKICKSDRNNKVTPRTTRKLLAVKKKCMKIRM